MNSSGQSAAEDIEGAPGAAEAPLRRLLALASAVGLPRQIEREETNATVVD